MLHRRFVREAAAVALAMVAGTMSALAATTNSARITSLMSTHPEVNVTVNTRSVLSKVPSTAVGINTAAWDPQLTSPVIPGLMRRAGIKVMRYPGGSFADGYDWKTNTELAANKSKEWRPATGFKSFMSVVRQSGAQAMITVNYGSNFTYTGGGTPANAAAWVQYANVTHHYNIKYWEIGNEVYGNGTYKTKWETDLHKQLGPTVYGKNALAFIMAMKKVDPKIKVGVVLTAPGNWPFGATPDWNSGVLSQVGKAVNFVDVHWYAQAPGHESDSELLASTNTIPYMVSTLRKEINQYCGSHAKHVQIMVTETNSVYSAPGKQTVSLVNALFLANDYMTWLDNGAANIDWWDLHNGEMLGTNHSSSLYGTAQYGDYGVLSYGNMRNGISEPPLNAPFPTYYGLQMLTHIVNPGARLVRAVSNQSMVQVYAARRADGKLSVLMINDSPHHSYNVHVNLADEESRANSATVYTYGENSMSIASAKRSIHGTAFRQTVPPYSLTTVVLVPAGHQGK